MTPTADRLRRLDAYVKTSVAQYKANGMTAQQCEELEAALRSEHIAEWMEYEQAQHIVLSVRLGGPGSYTKDELMSANRTSVTATEVERVGLLSRHLGIDLEEARKMVDRIMRHDEAADTGPADTPCALYRHLDADGALLYVGIATNPDIRREQHRTSSEWFRFAADMTVEWFDSTEDAAAAEREAITDEAPIFNKTHNKANRDAAVAYLFRALGGQQ